MPRSHKRKQKDRSDHLRRLAQAVRAEPQPDGTDTERLEHFRQAFGLLARPEDSDPGLAFWVPVRDSARPHTACSCPRPGCLHLRELRRAMDAYRERVGDDPEAAFERSPWHQLALVLLAAAPTPVAPLRLETTPGKPDRRLVAPDGATLLRLSTDSPFARRLLERLAIGTAASSPRATLRGWMARVQQTATEQAMNARGFDTLGQQREQSLARRFAYHAFRELPPDALRSLTADPDGQAWLTIVGPDDETLDLAVPRAAADGALAVLRSAWPARGDLHARPLPVRWVHLITATADPARVAVRPLLECRTPEPLRLAMTTVMPLVHGCHVYIAALSAFVPLPTGPIPEGSNEALESLPEVVVRLATQFGSDATEVEPALGPSRVFQRPDAVLLSGAWAQVAARYRYGEGSLELRTLLAARQRGARYLATASGWVDLESDEAALPAGLGLHDPLSPLDLLRLQAETDGAVEVVDDGPDGARLRALIELRPTRPYTHPKGLLSTLRAYQERGVEWLRFLFENGLSGLLCDDMGLGKTHQTLALLLGIREEGGGERPSLVVCPTTVLSHWRDKANAYAPSLPVLLHHGKDRSLAAVGTGAPLVLASYGVLRRDAELLAEIPFEAIVFDEIQHLKNRATLAYEAAHGLTARLRLGLTGTPIENSVQDLKTLFDVVLPGFLGSDAAFERRYVAIEGSPFAGPRLAELGRRTRPFVLRRTKAAVLAELPAKIEDVRTCALSSQQAALYREALSARGTALIGALRDETRRISYLHVFALIDLLKQICNHPALALKRLDEHDQMASGKWDLFVEILDECLSAGLKVVVFSQYLGMLELMSRHLDALGVAHARLTGQSRDRGRLIATFNEDPACRVFLASLLAGGTGIDLVGGSVVIHYDRWWNAAREDQATDRVHRIGQLRSVQVFKLVTEGTLEERIDAIIARKRGILDAVVAPDDPALGKAFSREEFLQILAAPADAPET